MKEIVGDFAGQLSPFVDEERPVPLGPGLCRLIGKELRAVFKISELRKDNNGKLPFFAWPGGYPMFYIDRGGGVFCPDCAETNEGIADYGINWEDENLYCDACSQQIQNAYGGDL